MGSATCLANVREIFEYLTSREQMKKVARVLAMGRTEEAWW